MKTLKEKKILIETERKQHIKKIIKEKITKKKRKIFSLPLSLSCHVFVYSYCLQGISAECRETNPSCSLYNHGSNLQKLPLGTLTPSMNHLSLFHSFLSKATNQLLDGPAGGGGGGFQPYQANLSSPLS